MWIDGDGLGELSSVLPLVRDESLWPSLAPGSRTLRCMARRRSARRGRRCRSCDRSGDRQSRRRLDHRARGRNAAFVFVRCRGNRPHRDICNSAVAAIVARLSVRHWWLQRFRHELVGRAARRSRSSWLVVLDANPGWARVRGMGDRHEIPRWSPAACMLRRVTPPDDVHAGSRP